MQHNIWRHLEAAASLASVKRLAWLGGQAGGQAVRCFQGWQGGELAAPSAAQRSVPDWLGES